MKKTTNTRAKVSVLIKMILVFFLLLSTSTSAIAKDEKPPIPSDNLNNGYTINFPEISIVEYIRFVGKICNVNFIYNKEDLQFNVSELISGEIR